ncbi:hypothetical protein [Adlercreutzia sp. ZJ473]|uniref:hypothetical protein n=1 Tax=Adlercreutzia sp. ZJ473 TaxID=2722822 RepID=UPI0015558DF8|nr:hypothetical protein [Adlercreutzia sp. ZJ473]
MRRNLVFWVAASLAASLVVSPFAGPLLEALLGGTPLSAVILSQGALGSGPLDVARAYYATSWDLAHQSYAVVTPPFACA